MLKSIQDQLNKTQYTDLSNFDEKTNTFIIPKYTKPVYETKKCYLVQLNSSILNNPNSYVAANMNNGRFPTDEYLKIYVNNVSGKFIYVNGLVYDIINKKDLLKMWSGWLPIDEITMISKM